MNILRYLCTSAHPYVALLLLLAFNQLYVYSGVGTEMVVAKNFCSCRALDTIYFLCFYNYKLFAYSSLSCLLRSICLGLPPARRCAKFGKSNHVVESIFEHYLRACQTKIQAALVLLYPFPAQCMKVGNDYQLVNVHILTIKHSVLFCRFFQSVYFSVLFISLFCLFLFSVNLFVLSISLFCLSFCSVYLSVLFISLFCLFLCFVYLSVLFIFLCFLSLCSSHRYINLCYRDSR